MSVKNNTSFYRHTSRRSDESYRRQAGFPIARNDSCCKALSERWTYKSEINNQNQSKYKEDLRFLHETNSGKQKWANMACFILGAIMLPFFVAIMIFVFAII